MLILLGGVLLAALVFGPALWIRAVMARHAGARADFPGTGSDAAAAPERRCARRRAQGTAHRAWRRTRMNQDYESPLERLILGYMDSCDIERKRIFYFVFQHFSISRSRRFASVCTRSVFKFSESCSKTYKV